MLTEVTTPVDGTSSRRPDPPRTVMWTIKQIAARDSVSKQAVSRKVGELVGLGLTVDRDGMGRVAAVNVVEYDRLRGRTDDPSKAQHQVGTTWRLRPSRRPTTTKATRKRFAPRPGTSPSGCASISRNAGSADPGRARDRRHRGLRDLDRYHRRPFAELRR